MGRPFKTYLNGTKIYSCSSCRCHSADHDDIISKVRYKYAVVLLVTSHAELPRYHRHSKAGTAGRTCSTMREWMLNSNDLVCARSLEKASLKAGLSLQCQRHSWPQRG